MPALPWCRTAPLASSPPPPPPPPPLAPPTGHLLPPLPQYDRPLGGGGATTPASEVESSYYAQIMAWRSNANYSAGSLQGMFGQQVAVVGHSMGGGLASIVAGLDPAGIDGVVLLDPVDYTQQSRRVARTFLAK